MQRGGKLAENRRWEGKKMKARERERGCVVMSSDSISETHHFTVPHNNINAQLARLKMK